MIPLSQLLEENVAKSYYASENIKLSRIESVATKKLPNEVTIWHENKGGNISPLPYSCALRAGASYNYLLVNGERRLTEREMLRLQGFPDSYRVVCGYQATRKQAGNSVAVPVVVSVIRSVISAINSKPLHHRAVETPSYAVQDSLFA